MDVLTAFVALFFVAGAVDVDLKIRTTGGTELPSDYVAENSIVRLECSLLNIKTQIFAVFVVSYTSLAAAEAGVGSNSECSCMTSNQPTGNVGMTNMTANLISQSVCTATSFSMNINVTATLPRFFRCQVLYAESANGKLSSYKIIRSYAEPNIITVRGDYDSLPLEDSLVSYVCSAAARPPPNLEFKYDGYPVDGVVQTPLPSQINPDSPYGTTTIRWNTTALAAMNRKVLTCEVVNFPSGNPHSKSTELAVIYGPDNVADVSMSWNMHSSSTFNVSCKLASNPDPIISWFNLTNPEKTDKIGEGRNHLVLNKADYSYITSTSPPKVFIYQCSGNNSIRGKIGYQKISVSIRTTETATNKPTAGGVQTSEGFPVWAIAVIVVVAVIVILIAVVVPVVVIRRRRTSPKKKKAAAAKNKTPSRESSSTTPQSNVSRPTSGPQPVEHPQGSATQPVYNPYNRYSQPNVENYAEAFDDKPRSRKPIAFDDMSLEPYDSAPTLEAGPPSYQDSLYRDYAYMNSPQGSYNMGYGAPC